MTLPQCTRLAELSAVSLDCLRLQWQMFSFARMKEIALKHPNAFDNAYNSSSGSSRNLEIFARRITKQEDRTFPRVFFSQYKQ